MSRPDSHDTDAALAPSSLPPKGSGKGHKLARGMALFTFALLLLGLIFWLLHLGFGSSVMAEVEDGAKARKEIVPDEPSSHAQPHQEKPEGKQQAPSDMRAKSDNTADRATHATKLQGPDAGQIVMPPSRNVTPNFQLSPLQQTKPLARTVGKALPPPPKLPPLPLIFRKVGIIGPDRLVLTTKLRSQSVQLSHVNGPDPKARCNFGGLKVPCNKMGKTALTRFIRGRAVGCIGLEDSRDRNSGSQTAQCFLGSGLKKRLLGDEEARVTDLAAWMVRYGWVVPDGDHYQAELAEAKRAKRGLYAPEPSGEALEALRQRQAESEALTQEIENELAGTIKAEDLLTVDEEDLSLFSGDALSPDQIDGPELP
nr:hypothetical protein [uncultured Cohaesibacter sp.]